MHFSIANAMILQCSYIYIYNQQEMQIHLMQYFEEGMMEIISVSKKRRLRSKRITREITCNVYCLCRLSDFEDKSKMIMCEIFKEWYQYCGGAAAFFLLILSNACNNRCQNGIFLNSADNKQSFILCRSSYHASIF